ncbi:MAG TPA: ATP-binding protein [Patescibacteria group bacterium]|nr:ATP-binding protein [Patescibacteria group bacterium]
MATYTLSFQSERKNIQKVEPFIHAIPECSTLGEAEFYNALIAVTEAVNNAIIHGNKCDASKIVLLEADVSEEAIVFTIQDEGEGFDPAKVADPRDPENLMREGGRGVFLIASLTQNAEYTKLPEGMRVTITVQR